jgi:integrase/recombinase XerD
MFGSWYDALGFDGCSSHSGRRTFITNAARNIGRFGGSLRDVQMLARHSSLGMTQVYIEIDSEAMRKVVDA